MKELFRVEIDTRAIRHNIGLFKKYLHGKSDLMCVIKANAYGHGMLQCAKISEEEGVSWLGVVNIEEALVLRSAGITSKILVIGYTPVARLKDAAQNNISVSIYNLDDIEEYSGEKLNIHLKVDTGLARMGFKDDEFASVLPQIVEQKNVVIEGVWTHLADAENPASYHTNTQIERFKKIKNVCSEHAIHPLFHVGASAATMLFAASHEDLVRVGVSMYGMWPSDETRESVENSDVASTFTLKSAFSYKTILVQKKQLSQGALVGYGCTYRVRKDTVLGVVPVGYAEGLPRLLSNNGHMLLRGKKVPIIGNVCMNMTMLDITGITEAKVSDEVVIIGKMGEEVITPEDHAKWTNTINYEVTTRVSERVPRVYV